MALSIKHPEAAVYGLSRSSGEPLLFRGTDFPKTDVELFRQS